MNIELFYQTLAKIIGDREGLEIELRLKESVMLMNIEILFQTLAKLLSEDKDYEVTFKIERKEDAGDGISLCEAS